MNETKTIATAKRYAVELKDLAASLYESVDEAKTAEEAWSMIDNFYADVTALKESIAKMGTDMATLPEGTQFYVVDGAWYGEIVVKDNEKYVNAYDGPAGEKRKRVRTFKLGPEGDADNVNILSDIVLPRK